MLRREFLIGMGAGLALALVPVPGMALPAPSIPILMFHKVVDDPRYPEDISTDQLGALFGMLWEQGFCPVNMTDILDGAVDRVVPRGLKPVGITADDAHRSILYSRGTGRHEQQRNARSFVDILRSSLSSRGVAPRATFFLCSMGDDRYSRQLGGYFGNYEPLAAALQRLSGMPGLEIGYHTRTHARMGAMGAEQVRALMKDQMDNFAALGVSDQVVPVLAYPYGVAPKPDGVGELRKMGFKGAVLAFPGVHEAAYDMLSSCRYDGRLVTDPFMIPRVCIGSHTYTYRNRIRGKEYTPIDPLDDFRKDVTQAIPRLYVSAGNAAGA